MSFIKILFIFNLQSFRKNIFFGYKNDHFAFNFKY